MNYTALFKIHTFQYNERQAIVGCNLKGTDDNNFGHQT